MRLGACCHSLIIGITSALVLVGLSCCASSRSSGKDAWTSKPRVTWSQILTTPHVPARQGYELVKSESTQGLFPASIGVTRVAYFEDTTHGGIPKLLLFRDPRNEFLRWNAAFDDQMPVSEVFPIDQRDLAGGEAYPGLVLQVFSTLHARIGFVYAVNELSENETEMIGALYDVASGEPLASVHAQAASVPPPDDDRNPMDLWETDSRALVRAAFARHVYQCLRTLIARDQSAAQESHEGWIPEGPIWPVDWSPRS